jgi:hypothetical protein
MEEKKLYNTYFWKEIFTVMVMMVSVSVSVLMLLLLVLVLVLCEVVVDEASQLR